MSTRGRLAPIMLRPPSARRGALAIASTCRFSRAASTPYGSVRPSTARMRPAPSVVIRSGDSPQVWAAACARSALTLAAALRIAVPLSCIE